MPLLCTSWELGSSTKFHCAFCTAQDSTAPCHSSGGSRLAWPTLSHHCQVLPQPSPGHSPFHEGTFRNMMTGSYSRFQTHLTWRRNRENMWKRLENINTQLQETGLFLACSSTPTEWLKEYICVEKVISVESNMHLTSAASQPMAATRINHMRRSNQIHRKYTTVQSPGIFHENWSPIQDLLKRQASGFLTNIPLYI